MEHINQLEPDTLLVGRYTIVKRIGGGGMGSVYLARDKRLADAYRAVKEMIGMFTDEAQRKKAVEDFERESQLLASLDHPSIPTIYDYFVFEGCYYLVMKYISGGDLLKRIKEAPDGRVDERTVTQWGIQICDVLSYLHLREPPIIYRDMKPANVMLDERNHIVLVDFGIARFVAPTQKNVTAIGTMGYAPPELFAGRVEPRSDLYSVGATMFHLLTGRDPQDNPLLMFDFNRNPKPRDINPELTTGIEEIICRAVEHKPANRFPSAGDMKKALEEHLRRLDAPAAIPAPSPEVVDAGIYCSKCGHELGPNDLFCNHCGTPHTAKAAAPQPGSLVWMSPNQQPISFILSKESSLLGRLDTNRGIIPDIDLTPFDKEGKVSRRHAIIHREGDQFFIEDLSSTNGTFLNSQERLTPKQKHAMNSGDELRLGDIFLKFFIGAMPPLESLIQAQRSPSAAVASGTQKNQVAEIPPKIEPSAKPAVAATGSERMEPAAPPPPPPSFAPKLPVDFRSAEVPGLRSIEAASAKNNPQPPVVEPPPPMPEQRSAPEPVEESVLGLAKEGGETGPGLLVTDVDFPKQVKLGEIGELKVGVFTKSGGQVKKPHTHDSEFEVTLAPEPSSNTAIEVYIAAPGFEVEPDIFTRLVVPPGRSASPAIFQLKGIQPGPTTVTIDFYQDPNYLSSVSVETEIVG